MRIETGIAAVAVGILLAAPVQAKLPVPPDLDAVRPVLEETLDASGVSDPDERASVVRRFDALAAQLAAEIGNASPERRAKRLHQLLHRSTLKLYRATADGPADIFDRGEYNCVSASILEALLGRAVGLETWLVAGPRHVFVRIELPGGRSVDVEATAPHGFDARRNAARTGRLLVAYKLASPDEISARGAQAAVDAYEGVGAPVPLVHAPAFVWNNTGERALERGDTAEAARSFGEAALRHPNVAMPGGAAEAAIARAFRVAYDRGGFEEAYRIATIGLSIAPDHVSARDRLVAAAVQRIEAAADAGEPASALEVLEDVRCRTAGDDARFERGAIPTIVASAVRVGAWELAGQLSKRYGEVQPDAVEAGRLRRWMASRAPTSYSDFTSP